MKILDIKKDEVFGTIYKFEHTEHPVSGINNSVFYDFTPYCNFDMEKIDNEVCLALSEIDLSKYPTIPGVVPPKIKEHNPHITFEHEYLYDYNGDKSVFQNMTQMQRRKYLFFRKKITIPWFFILDLKPNMFKTKKHDLQPWNEISNKFTYLKTCIEQMPFTEIGRVVIYGSWPESTVPCHRDDLPSNEISDHINFNPGGYRPLYVYDSQSDKKIYLPQEYKYYAFNTTDYHGVESVPHFSYTIRVDGFYDKTKVQI